MKSILPFLLPILLLSCTKDEAPPTPCLPPDTLYFECNPGGDEYLAAYYPFDGNALDESGFGGHGTVQGPYLRKTGKGRPTAPIISMARMT